jgi:hypothetical protein
MAYYAGAGCSYYDLYDHPSSGVNFTIRGIPPAQQRASDLHLVSVHASDQSSFRSGREAFHTLADRVIALPAALPAPTITTPPGGHKRLQASLTLPGEYQTSLQLWLFSQTGGASVTASVGWLGGQAATVALPDFSGVTGWSRSFVPVSSAPVSWFLIANGGNSAAAGGLCSENARFVVAMLNGRE